MIRKSILYLEQLEKMYDVKEAEQLLISKLKSGEYFNLKSLNHKKIEYLFYGVAKYGILNDYYKPIIIGNFGKLNQNINFLNLKVEKKELLIKFFQEKELYNFYEIGENLKDKNFKNAFIDNLDFKEISEVLNVIKSEKLFLPGLEEILVSDILDELDYYVSDIEIWVFIDDIDSYEEIMPPMMSRAELVEYYGEEYYEEDFFDEKKFDEEMQMLCSSIKQDIETDIRTQLGILFETYKINEQVEHILASYIYKEKIIDELNRYFYPEPDYDDRDEDGRGFEMGNADAADVVFDREYVEVDD